MQGVSLASIERDVYAKRHEKRPFDERLGSVCACVCIYAPAPRRPVAENLTCPRPANASARKGAVRVHNMAFASPRATGWMAVANLLPFPFIRLLWP